jgi:hypothetical protein
MAVGASALGVAIAYAFAIVSTDGDVRLAVLLVLVLVGLSVAIRPLIGLYLIFGAAVLFEQYEVTGLEPITSQAHVFQNLSGYTDLPIRLSAADLLMTLTLLSLLARRVALRGGSFGRPVGLFLGVFGIGVVIGLARGSGWDVNALFQELRGGPGQMCLMYFLAVNLLRTRGQLVVLAWELVLLVGVKSIQALLNYQDAQNLGLSLEAVTGHEDVVLFNLAIVLTVLIALVGARTKLSYAVVPVALLALGAELVTERRVAFVALGAALAMIAILYFSGGSLRRGLAFGAVGCLAVSAYLFVFWNESGPLGQPARAISGLLDPSTLSERDRSSNQWREIENRNIAYTIQQLPLTGVGVGQEYLFREEPPSLGNAKYFFWRNITHNTLLWFWLKVGPLGAFALWFLVARVLLVGSSLYRRLADPELRLFVALPMAAIVLWVTFAAVEPAMTFSRTLIVLGCLIGLGSTAATLRPTPLPEVA